MTIQRETGKEIITDEMELDMKLYVTYIEMFKKSSSLIIIINKILVRNWLYRMLSLVNIIIILLGYILCYYY